MVAILSAPAFAHDGHDHANTGDRPTQSIKENQSGGRESVVQYDGQKTEIENKQRVFKEQSKTDEHRNKLEGRRLAQCQNRQNKINSLMNKASGIGHERLARIQQLEEAIKNFYIKQKLASDSYESAVAAADQKEASAVAALDELANQKFDCAKVDGDNPAKSLKDAQQVKRQALNEYRESVKQLLAIVKDALRSKKSTMNGAGQ